MTVVHNVNFVVDIRMLCSRLWRRRVSRPGHVVWTATFSTRPRLLQSNEGIPIQISNPDKVLPVVVPRKG